MAFPRLLFQQTNELAEGPLWDDRTQTLYWIDILSGTIWKSAWTETGPAEPQAWPLKTRIGALGLVSDGSLIAGVEQGVASFFWGEEPRIIAQPSFDTNRVCFNDGKVGPDGAFWVGSKDKTHKDAVALLERFTSQEHSVAETGLTIANGLDWSPDGHWFYLTDSVPRVIWRYRWNHATSSISDREVFADGSEAPGVPDGLAVDAEGCVWSARWGGSQLVRLSPRGEVLERVAFPVSLVSSCAFGGPDLKTLFVTTAKEDLNPAQRLTERLAGSVFSLDVDVPGRPSFRYSIPSKETV